MLFKNDTHGLSTTKKYLDDTGLGHLSSLIISFVRNYASPKTHNHDGVYAKSSHAHTTAQVTGLDAALAGKAPSTHSHSIGQVTNLQSSLDSKVPAGRLINKKALSKDITLTPADIGADAQGSAATALDSAKAYTNTVAKTKAALSHTHTIAQVTDLQTSLDAKQPKGSYAASSHNHDASNITSGTVSTDRLPIIPEENGGTGSDNFSDAVNDMMSKIAITGATPSDSDYVIGQVANGGVIHRKTMSSIWTWIKSKCDAIYQAKGSYASANHTHNSIKDVGDGRDITFNYSADGMQDANWFAVWNGRELKSMSKQQMKTSLGIGSSGSSGGVNLGKIMYPVGAVYISYSSMSPANMFGGSWVAITGRFPYFNAGTSVGGSNTHTHTLNSGYAKITSGGSAMLFNYKNVNAFNTNWAVNGSANGSSSSSVTSATTLGGNTDSNYHMPAYQTLYAWRRTA